MRPAVRLNFMFDVVFWGSDYKVFGTCYMIPNDNLTHIDNVHLIDATLTNCNGDDVWCVGESFDLPMDYSPTGLFIQDCISHHILVNHELEVLDALR